MAEALIKLVENLEKIEPRVLQRTFPDKALEEDFIDCRQGIIEVLQLARNTGITPALQPRMDNLHDRISNIIDSVKSNTELGSKALTNRIIMWTDSNHLERSIYLAGQCHDKDIREPYKTQILLQPANACMKRYRTIHEIRSHLVSVLHSEPKEEIEIRTQMLLMALLDQFSYFAGAAYTQNPKHVYACYMQAMSHLFRAHRALAFGREAEFETHTHSAWDYVTEISEPVSESSAVELRYHLLNWGEFEAFADLSAKHSNIADHLQMLSEKASRVLDSGGGQEDPLSFRFSSYVGGTVKAASVAGIVAGAAGLGGLEFSTAVEAINELWRIAIDAVPGLEAPPSAPNETPQFAIAHSGGIVAPAAGVEFNYLSHSGGIV